MSVLKIEGRRRKKNWYMVHRSRAQPCHCRAVQTFWSLGMVGHEPCQGSGIPRLNFFRFLESCLDNYLQNNLKQRKTNKIKAIKCVGCLL